MSDRTFLRVFFIVLGLLIALTLGHFIYAVYAYNHCSIIYFIAKELW